MRILSLLREQTFRDYELLVCDDASHDDTWQWLDSLDWPELRVMRNEENRGLAGTLERLFCEARGEYVMIHHDHDPPEPTLIERMVDTLENNRTAGFACAAYHILRDDGTVVRDPAIEEFNLFPRSGVVSGGTIISRLAYRRSTSLCANGALFRRATVLSAGGYKADWGLAADEDLYRRVARLADVAFCGQRLFYLRDRPPESTETMGGWRGLLTLKAFRVDTARNFLQRGWFGRNLAAVVVSAIQWWGILRVVAYYVKRGNRARLHVSRDDRQLCTPAGPVLGRVGRAAFAFLSVFAQRLVGSPATSMKKAASGSEASKR